MTPYEHGYQARLKNYFKISNNALLYIINKNREQWLFDMVYYLQGWQQADYDLAAEMS